ncbi:MAG TPA: Hsp20/alpha crystallin family protein [Chthoniobacterales bacterium]|nr:Hsp20/alpha crystallin family protein [Chthoniobacterales bacterium]
MDMIKRRSTIVGIVTLIVGLVVGIGIGVWGIQTSHAKTAPASSTPATASSTTKSDTNTNGSDQAKDDVPLLIDKNWNPFLDFERMQEQIDRAIRDASEKFSFNQGANFLQPDAGYSSSFDLRDRKDHYELHAYLPDVNPSDVNVKIDNDQMLHVSVKQQKQQTKNTQNGSASITQLGEYEQVITLPEPVKSDQMKVDRKGHEIVITIPKANANTNNNSNSTT